MLFDSLADIKDEVSEAYQEALRQARRNIGKGIYMSRGRELSFLVNGKDDPRREEWNGTLKQLKSFIDEAILSNAPDVMIDGGINYAESIQDYKDGSYDPWVEEWSITIWENPNVSK
ncbi:MAG: hypothetical protein JEZ01_20970 [Labilibaculum sp.]|nr:hypothetical protein [Labilibaculum sp.]